MTGRVSEVRAFYPNIFAPCSLGKHFIYASSSSSSAFIPLEIPRITKKNEVFSPSFFILRPRFWIQVRKADKKLFFSMTVPLRL